MVFMATLASLDKWVPCITPMWISPIGTGASRVQDWQCHGHLWKPSQCRGEDRAKRFFFFFYDFWKWVFFFNSCLNLSFSNGIWIGWIFYEVVMFHILVHWVCFGNDLVWWVGEEWGERTCVVARRGWGGEVWEHRLCWWLASIAWGVRERENPNRNTTQTQ